MNSGTSGDTPSWEQVEHYLDAGQSVVFRLSQGQGREVVYQADGRTRSVDLVVELQRGEQCPPSPSPVIEVTEVSYRGHRAARVRSCVPDLIADFHDLVSSLASRIIRYGYALAEALGATIRSWHRLIDARRMQESNRIGLLGELLVLAKAAEAFGWSTAVSSWAGPTSEVHDFALPEFDVEVKTTSSERRRHRVNGIGQFSPKPDRVLWCVSIQVVRGGDAGRSLTQSAESCLVQARAESVLVEASLGDALTMAGLSEFDDAAREEKWLLRSTPMMLHSFAVPRIDESAIVPELRDRVSAVSYDVDLTGIEASQDAPMTFHSIDFP